MKRLLKVLMICTIVIKAMELFYLYTLWNSARYNMAVFDTVKTEQGWVVDTHYEFDASVVFPALLGGLVMVAGGVLLVWGLIRLYRKGVTRMGVFLQGGATAAEVLSMPVFMKLFHQTVDFMFYRYVLCMQGAWTQEIHLTERFGTVKYIVLGLLIVLDGVIVAFMAIHLFRRGRENKPQAFDERNLYLQL